MIIYVKNNFNPQDNNKYLTVLRRWQRSLYYMKVFPGETNEPIELPDLDDEIVISIAPDSPMRECTKPSRVTYDECLDMHLDITPPSVMIDYPYSVEVKGNKKKVSIAPGRHDWKVTISHPEKAVDEWTPGMEPGTVPAELTVVVGDDIDI
jgi:hypothetical protein